MVTRKKTTILIVALLLSLVVFISPSSALGPEINVVKYVEPPLAQVGDIVTYSIIIYNSGDCQLENIEVEDSLLSPIFGDPIIGLGFCWRLAPGEAQIKTFPYVVQEDDPSPLESCVVVTSSPTGSNELIEDQDCVTVTINPPANVPPQCSTGGPYIANCQGFTTVIQLDGTGSIDPDGGPLTYEWTTDCVEATLIDPQDAQPILIVDTSQGILINCDVTLTVTDEAGTVDTCVTSVAIEACSPSNLATDLTVIVEDLNLQQGIDSSLDVKIDTALQAMEDINENNDIAAINALYAFINCVEAQRDKKITSEQADELIAYALAIIDSLNGE